MKKELKNNLLIVGIIILIILIIVLILYLKQDKTNEEIMLCIASKAVLVESQTCSHCIAQKMILGNYVSNFTMIDIADHPEIFSQYNLIGTPTWIINNQTYPGVKQISELKQLTGC